LFAKIAKIIECGLVQNGSISDGSNKKQGFWTESRRKGVSLQKKSCTRQFESELSLRSFALSLQREIE